MSSRHHAIKDGRPFAFSPEYDAKAKIIVARYPEGRQASAVLPLLDLAQRQHDNWLSLECMDYVADYLDMPSIRVYEVATFYTMFNLAPVGKYHLQLCTTTPCWLRGSDDVVAACKKFTGIGFGERSSDGLWSMVEVECVGACVNAPVLQVNDDFYEDVDGAITEGILRALKSGETPPHGPQIDRHKSAPAGELTSLSEQAPAGSPSDSTKA
jgi:NADH-quinone oxidoreductase E subunit